MDFIDATDWAHISDPWQLSNWKGSPFTMVWGVPMVPCGGSATQCPTNVSDYNEVADGGADGYYKTLAQNLVNGGFGTSYIRLGWEFNADWMGWGICNEDGSGLTSWAGDFVPAFRNIVTSMRSVSGANFKFIWNPIDSSNVSCPGVHLEDFYPGDSYVDVVALDVYDGIGTKISSEAARWSDLLNGVNAGDWTSVAADAISGQKFQGYGLTWLAAFGKAHNKEIGLPEWGLDSTSMDGGGGDDAYFMTQMANWIKANDTGPESFWNSGDSGGTLEAELNIPRITRAKIAAGRHRRLQGRVRDRLIDRPNHVFPVRSRRGSLHWKVVPGRHSATTCPVSLRRPRGARSSHWYIAPTGCPAPARTPSRCGRRCRPPRRRRSCRALHAGRSASPSRRSTR